MGTELAGVGTHLWMFHLAMALPVFKSFLHAIQYSPRASWNVIVVPALHQGQKIVLGCLVTRILVVRLVVGWDPGGRHGDAAAHSAIYGHRRSIYPFN